MSGRLTASRRALLGTLLLLAGAFVLAGGAHAAADLTVALSVPANLTDNTTFNVTVSATNLGNGNAGPGVLANLTLDGNSTGPDLDYNNVAPGATDLLFRNLTAVCGAHTLVAVIDPSGSVPESDDTNNNATLNFTVLPYVNVTYNLSGNPGEINVTLDASASHGCDPLNFTWVGDGLTQYGPMVTYTPAGGTFTVTLTVDGALGPTFTVNITQAIPIPNSPPTLSLSLPSSDILTMVPIGLVIQAVDEDGSIAMYEVAFGDGGTTIELPTVASYQYQAAGDYTINVTVTDNAGATNTSTIGIHIRNRPPTVHPQTAYLVTTTDVIDFGDANASDPEGGALTYSWNFGDGTGGTGPGVTHRYAEAGTYTVRLNVTDANGGSVEQTITVQVVGGATSDNSWWLWIIIVLVILAVLAFLFMRMRRKDDEPKYPEKPATGEVPPTENKAPEEGISGKPPSP